MRGASVPHKHVGALLEDVVHQRAHRAVLAAHQPDERRIEPRQVEDKLEGSSRGEAAAGGGRGCGERRRGGPPANGVLRAGRGAAHLALRHGEDAAEQLRDQRREEARRQPRAVRLAGGRRRGRRAGRGGDGAGRRGGGLRRRARRDGCAAVGDEWRERAVEQRADPAVQPARRVEQRGLLLGALPLPTALPRAAAAAGVVVRQVERLGSGSGERWEEEGRGQ